MLPFQLVSSIGNENNNNTYMYVIININIYLILNCHNSVFSGLNHVNYQKS